MNRRALGPSVSRHTLGPNAPEQVAGMQDTYSAWNQSVAERGHLTDGDCGSSVPSTVLDS